MDTLRPYLATVKDPENERGGPAFDMLMERIGDATVVLIGEASHGTHEFYAMRAALTRRLITEKGFNAVAVEADWPDAYRVNTYVRGMSDDRNASEALSDFRRFPTWMWRNTVVRDFVGWLRVYNDSLSDLKRKTGFYGLDLYSLYSSMAAVIKYLDEIDPEAAQRARQRYGCFEQFGDDPQIYGYSASLGVDKSCQDQAMQQLTDLRRSAAEYVRRDVRIPEDAYFYAEQNARLAKNAEAYYRTMFHGRASTWNLRDQHMADTLQALCEHLSNADGPAKIVVWAHNSHLGNARATEMHWRGELTLGQLAREHYGDDMVNIGFSTYSGSVTAATDWGDLPEHKRVRPGLRGSYEDFFHGFDEPGFAIDTRAHPDLTRALSEPRLQRAIGVIYRPESERVSHYFEARLPDQFDAMIHLDKTRALEPLEINPEWREEERVPDTYPFGQ